MKTAQEIFYEHDSDVYADGPVYSESGYSATLVLKMLEEMEAQYKDALSEDITKLSAIVKGHEDIMALHHDIFDMYESKMKVLKSKYENQ